MRAAALLGLALVYGRAEARASESRSRLAWHTSLPAWAARRLAERFNESYPWIHLEPVRNPGPWGAALAQWARADVITDGRISRRPDLRKKGLLARLDFLGTGSFPLCGWALDPDRYYVYAHADRFVLDHNPDVSDPPASPKSLAELAEPRWKGKVVLPDPESPVLGGCLYRFILAHPSLGSPWLERMRRNQALVMADARIGDAVRTGLRPAGFGGLERSAAPPAPDGARPRAIIPQEGSVFLLYATAVSGRSGNPSAARLFVEWLLSPGVQRHMQEEGISLSLLGESCGTLERGMRCVMDFKGGPSETALVQREAARALLGE